MRRFADWPNLLVGTSSQYSNETANLLAKQLLDGATADTTIAVVSAPSVFVGLKNAVVRSVNLYSPGAIIIMLLLNQALRFR